LDLSNLKFGNAAGDVKTLEQVRELARAPISHLVVGSITVEQRDGNEGNTFWVSPDDRYALNARGLPCRGIDYYHEHGPEMAAVAHAGDKKLIVSIASTQSHDDWVQLAECAAKFADGIEINISCPNKWSDGKRESVIASNPEAVNAILRSIIMSVPANFPLSLKLAPFLPGGTPLFWNMMEVIRSHSNALREVVSCNTVGGVTPPSIDGKKVISMPQAGMSGPDMKVTSLLQVGSLVESLPDIPIIGVGGIRSGTDVAEYVAAGASGVQIGTHYFQYGERVFEEIALELAELDLAEA